MIYSIDTALVAQYRSNLEVQFQQKGSRLRSLVRVEMQVGEFGYYDRIGATTAVKIVGRNLDTPLIDVPFDRRRVQMVDYDWADLIDSSDRIRMLADPTGPYTMDAVYALGRAMDNEIIAAATGNASSGKTGGTNVAYPTSTQQIAVTFDDLGGSSNTNLTIAKLRRAKQLLMQAEAVTDGEPLVAVVSASQITALLRTTQVTSADYNSVKALVNGEIDTFMGFKFTHTELLAYTDPGANTLRSCLFFPSSAMLLAVGQDIFVDVGPRRDKRNAVQVYARATFGATRMWELQMVNAICDETK